MLCFFINSFAAALPRKIGPQKHGAECWKDLTSLCSISALVRQFSYSSSWSYRCHPLLALLGNGIPMREVLMSLGGLSDWSQGNK